MHYAKLIGSLIIAAAPLLADAKLNIRQGRPVAEEVYVNGHGPYSFLIDTGAQTNQISAELAHAIGLVPTFQVELVTAAGSAHVPGTKGLKITVDTQEATDQEFLFTDLDAVRRVSSSIQGVLGQAFLGQFDYMLDLRSKHLSFGKQNFQGTRTVFKLIEGRPAVFSSLGWLVLDSGADRLILFGVESSKRTQFLRTASGFAATGMLPAKPLVIEGRPIHHGEAIGVATPSVTAENGLLPASLFHTVYVCNSEGYLILE